MHSLCCWPPDKLIPGLFSSSFTSSHNAAPSRLSITISFMIFYLLHHLILNLMQHYQIYSWLERIGFLKYHTYAPFNHYWIDFLIVDVYFLQINFTFSIGPRC